MTRFALLADRVLTPDGFVSGQAVLVDGGRIAGVCRPDAVPADAATTRLEGDLVPGFIDLQVNGGGGVLFNDAPSPEGLRIIAEAHRRFGTTALLPTLISDDLSVVEEGIAAVAAAIAQGVPGIIGLHIEGPFLNPERKGIHDAAKIRRLDEEGIDLLGSLQNGRTLVTLAPELAPPGAIARLVDAGVVVAAGHTAASWEQMQDAFAEGLSGFTHLFNAMSPLTSRAPGAVGAALERAEAWCGIIVDGHHVHPAALRIALAAKGAERFALVTDAMPLVGTREASFSLGGRDIRAEGGRLVDAEGTLAGSSLDMGQAVANAVRLLGLPVETAIRMASRNPAAIIGEQARRGEIRPGLAADLVLLGPDLRVLRTWIGGESEA